MHGLKLVISLTLVLAAGCSIFRDSDGIGVADGGIADTGVQDTGSPDAAGSDAGDLRAAPDVASACPGVDLTSDPDNCGGCDVRCFSQCTEGTCDAVVVADGQGDPFGIAVDASFVYWANENPATVWRAPKGGGPAEMLASSATSELEFNPRYLHLTATDVIVSTENSGSIGHGRPLFRIPKSGGAATGFGGPVADDVQDFVLAGALVYMAQQRVDRVLKGYFDRTPTEELPGEVPGPYSLALDGSTLYWGGSRGLGSMTLDGATVTPIAAADITAAAQVVVDGGKLYVATGAEVLSVDPGTQSFEVLATSLFGARALAVEGSDVFFTVGGNATGSVLRVPRDGSAEAEVLVGGLPAPFLITADDEQVFWTNRGTADNGAFVPESGVILRRAR